MLMRSIVAIAVAVLLTMSSQTAAAKVVVKEFKLLSAAGVPGEPVHKYTFSATMEIPGSSSKSGIWPFVESKTTNPLSFFAVGQGRWDKATGETTEALKVSGGFNGTLQSIFKCGGDPWLGSGGCTFVAAKAEMTSGEETMLSAVKSAGHPFTAGRVNPLEAEVLSSKQPKASNPPPPPAPAAKADWKSARPADQPFAPSGVQLAKPSLVVIGVQPKLDPACPNPAQPFVAAVSVRHTGLPLAAGKGHLRVVETWGTNLKSKNIALPSFSTNAVRVVEVPIQVSSTSLPGLPGTHKLGVDLDPLVVGGQPAFIKPGEAYVFSVTFPAGYCQPKFHAGDAQKSSVKGPSGSGVQVPAVQRQAVPSPAPPPTR